MNLFRTWFGTVKHQAGWSPEVIRLRLLAASLGLYAPGFARNPVEDA